MLLALSFVPHSRKDFRVRDAEAGGRWFEIHVGLFARYERNIR